MAGGDDLMLDENVVAYRLGKVEESIAGVATRLDTYFATAVTKEILSLHLLPVEKRVVALETKLDQKDKDERSQQFQTKLAVVTAFLSPIIAAIAAVLIVK